MAATGRVRGAEMEASVRDLFQRYERTFNEALAGRVVMDEVAELYASEFIAAGPAGVAAGRNDAAFREAMAQGYDHYRSIGTKAMRIRDVRLSPIDDRHSIVHVDWTATYARKDRPDIAIDFEVHYLVQTLDGVSRVFGWVAGDERALLEQHGIV